MVTILTGPTIFHIHTFARPVGSTRSRHWSRRHNQGMRERCCQLLARWKGFYFSLISPSFPGQLFFTETRPKFIETYIHLGVKRTKIGAPPVVVPTFFLPYIFRVFWRKFCDIKVIIIIKNGYCKITTRRFPLHDYAYRWRIRDENNYLIQHVACCKVIRKSVARVL